MSGLNSVSGPGAVARRKREVRRWIKRPLRSRRCQTNGRLFRFKSAKRRARSFQRPALPAKPKLLRRVDSVGAIAKVWRVVCWIIETVGPKKGREGDQVIYMSLTVGVKSRGG